MESAKDIAESKQVEVAEGTDEKTTESINAVSDEMLPDIDSEEGLQMKLGRISNECNVSLGMEMCLGLSKEVSLIAI